MCEGKWEVKGIRITENDDTTFSSYFLEIGHQKAAFFLGKSRSSKPSGGYRALLRSLSS